MNCLNCEQKLSGNFCNNCGQKSNTVRIDFQYLINEIPNSILQVNRGFLYTSKELFLRPGHTIRAFLNGSRRNHYRPVAFLIVATTVYLLTAYLIGSETLVTDGIKGFKEGMSDSGDLRDLEILTWLANNQNFVILAVIPIFSISSYLAFIRSKLNYFEHLVANLYITGQQMIIYLLFGLILYTERLEWLPFAVGFLYNYWAFNQIFEEKSQVVKLGLMSLTYLLFLTIFMSIVLIIAWLFMIPK